MNDLSRRKEQLKSLLKIAEKEQRVAEIAKAMQAPQFWQERERSAQVTQELNGLQELVRRFETAATEEELVALESQTLLSGPYDENNAIFSIHAGAGGTDAQDWAAMLLEMYRRYAERKNFSYKILQQSLGEEAGIKSVTVELNGRYAYGLLKNEAGVHRLVRLSPFNADHLRQTSFALVEVIPELQLSQDIGLDEKELKIDTFRASGHGGQGVNTTDSAVRITHLPTGLVATCQNERSQLQNKQQALTILKGKLAALRLKEAQTTTAQLKGDHIEAGWGNQIRSYVLHPYKQVKDHRTGVVASNPSDVLAGKLDKFIEAELRKSQLAD